MKKILILCTSFILIIGLINPAFSEDQERILTLEAEIESKQIKQYLQPFENYLNMISGNPSDTMSANSMVSALNALIKKYPTVNELYALTTELIESGYYSDSVPMLLYSFHHSLERVRGFGFGTAKLGSWQFKHMNRFGSLKSVTGSGMCEQMVNSVFYTTIKHPSKNYSFGFYLSAGYGFVDQETLKGKSLKEECI